MRESLLINFAILLILLNQANANGTIANDTIDNDPINATIIEIDSISTCDLNYLITIIQKSNNTNLKIYAIEALGTSSDDRSIIPLSNALNDSNNLIRGAAAEALGNFGNSTVIDYLLNALDDPDANVRVAAINALGDVSKRTGDRRGVGPLIQKLGDNDESVKSAVIDSLIALNDSRAIMPFGHILKDNLERGQKWWWMAIGIIISIVFFLSMLYLIFSGKPDNDIKWRALFAAVYILILISVEGGLTIYYLNQTNPRILYVPAAIIQWGFVGGIIGVLYKLTEQNKVDYVLVLTKPFIGLVMGGIVYFLVQGGGMLIGLSQPSLPSNTIYLLCAFAFVSGFSDKFSIDLIKRFEGSVTEEGEIEKQKTS